MSVLCHDSWILCKGIARYLTVRMWLVAKQTCVKVLFTYMQSRSISSELRRSEAVSAFLAEAAALVARKPGELFELTQSLLSATAVAHGPVPSVPSSLPAGGPGQGFDAGSGSGFSLLAVAALRQAVRVAGSGKMAAEARAGVAAYVAGAPSTEPTSTEMLSL